MTFPGARRGTMVEPGLYDEDGVLHFYVEEFCAGHGIPLNAHNLALVERTMRDEFAKRYPGTPIHDTYEPQR